MFTFCYRSSVASAAIAQAQWSNVSTETFLSFVVMIYFQTKSGNEGGHQQVLNYVWILIVSVCACGHTFHVYWIGTFFVCK